MLTNSFENARAASLIALAVWGLMFCAASRAESTLKFQMQGPAERADAPVPRDALNRLCLDAEAVARSHVVNPDIVDHVVSLKNKCSRTIKVRVCYFQTDRCKELDVRGFDRADTILGTMTKVKMFRYSISQK